MRIQPVSSLEAVGYDGNRFAQIQPKYFRYLAADPVNGMWMRPPPGCMKLNVDGGCRDGCAVVGGVLEGYWLWGFTGIVRTSLEAVYSGHATAQGLNNE